MFIFDPTRQHLSAALYNLCWAPSSFRPLLILSFPLFYNNYRFLDFSLIMTHQAKLDSLIEDLRQVAQSSNEARNATIDSLRALSLSLETKQHVYNRFEQMGLELTISRVGQDLNIYQILSESNEPVRSSDLAAKVGSAPLLTR